FKDFSSSPSRTNVLFIQFQHSAPLSFSVAIWSAAACAVADISRPCLRVVNTVNVRSHAGPIAGCSWMARRIVAVRPQCELVIIEVDPVSRRVCGPVHESGESD